jgi:hypothetical protein
MERTTTHDHTAEVGEASVSDDEGVGAKHLPLSCFMCVRCPCRAGVLPGLLRSLRGGRDKAQSWRVCGGSPPKRRVFGTAAPEVTERPDLSYVIIT